MPPPLGCASRVHGRIPGIATSRAGSVSCSLRSAGARIGSDAGRRVSIRRGAARIASVAVAPRPAARGLRSGTRRHIAPPCDL